MLFKNKLVNLCSYFFLFLLYFLAIIFFMVQKTWGDIDFLTMVSALTSNIRGGVPHWAVFKILCATALSIFLSGITVLFLNKNYKNSSMAIPPVWFAVYLFVVFCLILYLADLAENEKLFFCMVTVFIYHFNLRRNFTPVLILTSVIIWLFVEGFFLYNKYKGSHFFVNNKLYDYYEFVDMQNISVKQARNIIIVYAESFEREFGRFSDGTNQYAVDVEGAVSFDGFMEGHSQRTTIDALYAGLTGEYKYVSETLTGKNLQQKKVAGWDEGKRFGLGNMLSLNGYQMLFVQGGDIDFVATDIFLNSQGFEKKNIFDRQSFEYVTNYHDWWGVNDSFVFELFKNKISQLDPDVPFFAVMFTIDLHHPLWLGDNPHYTCLQDIQKATIDNLNGFVSWFRKQPFSENTSLIIVGDHKRMGKTKTWGRRLFNAFYNLPETLKKQYNNTRRFGHIDLCPTIMEIAGATLPNRRYGLGVSIFSDNKTLEERFGDY